MQEFLGFVVICIQNLIFLFLTEVELEAASSFKMSETSSTLAWYQNPIQKIVHVIKSNTKYYMLFIPCMLLHQYTILTIPNNVYILNDHLILHSWVQPIGKNIIKRQMNAFCLPCIKIWWIHPYYSDIL